MTQSEYFNRQIQLWGSSVQQSLEKKKIAIIGSGGLGCTLAMALGTSGIGEIHMVDFDTVSSHNMHIKSPRFDKRIFSFYQCSYCFGFIFPFIFKGKGYLSMYIMA